MKERKEYLRLYHFRIPERLTQGQSNEGTDPRHPDAIWRLRISIRFHRIHIQPPQVQRQLPTKLI